MKDILTTTDLSVRYGGNLALDSVSIRVAEGELVGLIGPNGAGKTTFIDALTGFARSSGSVVLAGSDLSHTKAHRRAQLGLGRSWQGAELFDDLTVRENLQVAAAKPSVRQAFAELVTGRPRPDDAVAHVVELLELEGIVDAQPADVSQGQRKLVDVARSLAAQPVFLCLDEPAAGLDSTESEDLGRRLRRIVDDGTSLLLVDHDMGLVLGICDRIYVLNLGHVIAEGTPEEIRASELVIQAYLGEEESTADSKETSA